MVIFGIIAVAFAVNATCGIVYRKMWLQNRLIGPDHPEFTTLIVVQIFLVGVITAIIWTGLP